MPLYEYECDNCGQRFEVIQKFSDAPPAVCRKCGGGPVRKLLSSPAIQFKGSGFYLTDYGRGTSAKSEGATPTAGKTEGGASSGEGSAAKSDSGNSSSGSSDSKASTSDTSSTKSTPAKSE